MGAKLHFPLWWKRFASYNLWRKRWRLVDLLCLRKSVAYIKGGSVMLQSMAFGGYLGSSLFSNVSPIQFFQK